MGHSFGEDLPLRPSQWMTLALRSDVMPLLDEAVLGPGQLCGAPGKLGISPLWNFCGLSRCTLPAGDGRDSLLKKKKVYLWFVVSKVLHKYLLGQLTNYVIQSYIFLPFYCLL